MSTVYLPRGSVFSIQATDVSANGGDGSVKWNKVTEHNRGEFAITFERIEKVQRTSNGTLRKNYINDKRKFSTSWNMLPSYRTLTVDGSWGAEDLRSFYLGDGKDSFKIRINFAKSGSDQSSSGYEEYTVIVSNFNAVVVKRGLQPFWNVTLEMDEV